MPISIKWCIIYKPNGRAYFAIVSFTRASPSQRPFIWPTRRSLTQQCACATSTNKRTKTGHFQSTRTATSSSNQSKLKTVTGRLSMDSPPTATPRKDGTTKPFRVCTRFGRISCSGGSVPIKTSTVTGSLYCTKIMSAFTLRRRLKF